MLFFESDGVGCFTPSVKIDKRFRQLPQGGSQADDGLSFEQTLASLPEGGGTRSVTEGVVLRSALCVPTPLY